MATTNGGDCPRWWAMASPKRTVTIQGAGAIPLNMLLRRCTKCTLYAAQKALREGRFQYRRACCDRANTCYPASGEGGRPSGLVIVVELSLLLGNWSGADSAFRQFSTGRAARLRGILSTPQFLGPSLINGCVQSAEGGPIVRLSSPLADEPLSPLMQKQCVQRQAACFLGRQF